MLRTRTSQHTSDADCGISRVDRFEQGRQHLPGHCRGCWAQHAAYLQPKIHLPDLWRGGAHLWLPGPEDQPQIQCLRYAPELANYVQQKVQACRGDERDRLEAYLGGILASE
jgi:hypothetical protein